MRPFERVEMLVIGSEYLDTVARVRSWDCERNWSEKMVGMMFSVCINDAYGDSSVVDFLSSNHDVNALTHLIPV